MSLLEPHGSANMRTVLLQLDMCMQDCQKLISRLLSFEPPKDLPKVNILLVGAVGAGKSSLISSIDSIFKWRISRRAPHGQATSSFTRLVTRYTFKSNSQNWTSKGNAACILFLLNGCISQYLYSTAMLMLSILGLHYGSGYKMMQNANVLSSIEHAAHAFL